MNKTTLGVNYSHCVRVRGTQKDGTTNKEHKSQ